MTENKTTLVEIISEPSDYSFPDDWYELADEKHFWSKARFRAFLSQIENKHINLEGLHGIEIGCGSGLVRRQIESSANCTIDGADIQMSGLRRNNTKTGRTLFYDIHDRNHQLKDFYDFIIIFDVLEHIEDVKRFMESALFHLKKGGYIFINVPAIQQLSSRYDRTVGHLRRYDKSLLRRQLRNPEIEIIDVRYWGLSMVPVLFLRKIFGSSKMPDQEIIKKGFRPSSSFVNNLLGFVVKAEQSFLKKPFVGTSLMAIAIKK